jgi:polar amino acid transport system substrate-binding protein
VRDAAPQQALDEVDRPGTRVVVGRGSAYDLYLTRTLQHAEIVRAPTSPSVVEVFADGGFDVAAGVRQQLEADRTRYTEAGLPLRLLPGAFMVIRQAMGLPKHRSPQAALALHEFVERHKRSGFIADALRRHGIEGASVAPAETPPEHTA